MTTPFDQLKTAAESVDDRAVAITHIEFTHSTLVRIMEFAEAHTSGSVGDVMATVQSIYFSCIINLIKNVELSRDDAIKFLTHTQQDQLRFSLQAIENFEDFSRG